MIAVGMVTLLIDWNAMFTTCTMIAHLSIRKSPFFKQERSIQKRLISPPAFAENGYTAAREKVCLKPIYAKLCEQCPKNFKPFAFCRKAPVSRDLRSKMSSFLGPLLTELEKHGFGPQIPLFHGQLYIHEKAGQIKPRPRHFKQS